MEFKSGNLFSEDVEALVNTVNCVGVMGRGIALQFKKAFPGNFKSYAAACKREEVMPGRMFIFNTGELTGPRYIINFPTKRHWRGKSRMEDIESGLAALAQEIQARNIRSIAIPPLGCGLGGLNWKEVRSRIETAFQDLENSDIVIFEPSNVPIEPKTHCTTPPPKMTAGRAALVGLMHQYLGGLLDPFISLLEVHKLLYFLQVAGEPLRLNYEKGHFGPYAENLRHVLHAVEGHLISGYADGGDEPKKQLTLMPGALDDAQEFLTNSPSTQANFKKVSDLVSGFESPFGLELLSTIHWVATRDLVQSVDDVVKQTYAWSDRKKRFSQRQIALAIEILVSKNWISAPQST